MTEELLSAYVDNELTGDERARVERLLETDPSCRDLVDSLIALRADFRSLEACHLDRQFNARVLAATAQRAAAGSAPSPVSTATKKRQTHAPSRWHTWFYVAAAVSAVLLLALLFRPHQTDVSPTSVALAPPSAETSKPTSPATKPADSHRQANQDSLRQSPHVSAGADSSVASNGTPAIGEHDVRSKAKNPSTNATTPARPAATAVAGGPTTGPARSDALPAAVDKASSAKRLHTGMARSAPAIPKPTSSGSSVNVAKLPGSDQLLLVMDVFLTPRGHQRRCFDQLLVQQGLPFFATVPVRDKLQDALLASRFFKPARKKTAKVTNGTGPNESALANQTVQLVYVVARGGQMDELWQALRGDKQNVSGVAMDLAFRPGELDMFRELRQAAETALATRTPAADTRASAAGGPVPNGAYRLVLPPTWRGQPARLRIAPPNAASPAARSTAVPQTMGTGRLGENLVVEILFVLHQMPPAKVPAK